MEKLVLIGAGGHSKSVADCIDIEKYDLIGFLDENKTGFHINKPIFGSKFTDVPNYRSCKYFVAIGDVNFRKVWFDRIKQSGLETINIIDRSAIISSSARIGCGNFIGKYSVINADSEIGDDNVINTRALIEHECKVGNHTHLSTNSVINGNVVVGDSVFFGSSAVSNGQLKIGEGAVVGSGSVIIKDVEPYTTVVGVPARVVKKENK